MITSSQQDAILEMHKKEVSLHEISRILHISRNAVRKVVQGNSPEKTAKQSQYEQYLPEVRALFTECRGNVVRVAEELAARHSITIAYQSLTWLIRKYSIRTPKQKRSGEYVFEPGIEMQHDTSPHTIMLGDKKVTAQCASLVLSYSRKIFIQYFPCFTRFECKVFLTKALEFMDGACDRCIIDNTSVIVAHGVGPDALITPEMQYLFGLYGVRFEPHWLNDPNRKGKIERPFYYVETNFLPGRSFQNWQDLNQQAENWCRQKANKKIKRALGMSPDEAYIIEKPSLNPLPPFSPPVYQSCDRVIDIQGYAHLDTNRYSVPEALVGYKVEVQKHWLKVIIYHKYDKVAEHDRILDKKDSRVTLPGHHPPLNRQQAQQGPAKEETCLLGQNATLDRYVAELKKRSRGRGVINLRRLLNLQRTYPREPFVAAIEHALKYGLYDLARLEKIIIHNTAGDFFNLS